MMSTDTKGDEAAEPSTSSRAPDSSKEVHLTSVDCVNSEDESSSSASRSLCRGSVSAAAEPRPVTHESTEHLLLLPAVPRHDAAGLSSASCATETGSLPSIGSTEVSAATTVNKQRNSHLEGKSKLPEVIAPCDPEKQPVAVDEQSATSRTTKSGYVGHGDGFRSAIFDLSKFVPLVSYKTIAKVSVELQVGSETSPPILRIRALDEVSEFRALDAEIFKGMECRTNSRTTSFYFSAGEIGRCERFGLHGHEVDVDYLFKAVQARTSLMNYRPVIARSAPTVDFEGLDPEIRLFESLCDLCMNVFPSAKDVEYHMQLVHGVVRESYSDKITAHLPCEFCTSTFDTHRSLSQHVDSAHGLRFTCDDCKEKFRDDKTLHRHRAAVHGSRTPVVAVKRCGGEPASTAQPKRSKDN